MNFPPHDPRSAHRPGRPTPVFRRRRRLLGASAVVLAASGFGLFGGFPFFSSGEPPAAASGHPVAHLVQPGDTVWGIVESVHPGTDPRPLVDRLVQELDGAPLQVGQIVEVP